MLLWPRLWDALFDPVMGVLADLSGKPVQPLPPVGERKFLDIDIDNFDERMKSIQPRVAYQVPNTLTGEGNLNIDITFESLDDFSPAAVAGKVFSLSVLLGPSGLPHSACNGDSYITLRVVYMFSERIGEMVRTKV